MPRCFFVVEGRFSGFARTTLLSSALLVSACTGRITEPGTLSSGARAPNPNEELDAGPSLDEVDAAGGLEVIDGVDDALIPDAQAAPGADSAVPIGVASSGCGKAAPYTGWKAQSITVGGQRRTYDMGVPTAYNSQTRHALVFAYHGLGDEGLFLRNLLDMERFTNNQAIFVYPDGLPVPEGSSGWDTSGTGRDVKMFDALVAELSAKFCIDQSAIFALGFSYGGWMVNALGCHRSDKVAGIAPMAGGGPETTCNGPVPAMIIHGETDQVEPLSTGRKTRDYWRTANGCTTSTSAASSPPCVSYTGCTAPLLWCQFPDRHIIPEFAPQAMWTFFSGLRQ